MNHLIRYLLLNMTMLLIVLSRGILFFSTSFIRKTILFIGIITIVSYPTSLTAIIAIFILFILGMKVTKGRRMLGATFQSSFEIRRILDIVLSLKAQHGEPLPNGDISFIPLVLPAGTETLKVDIKTDYASFKRALFLGKTEYVIYYSNDLLLREEFEKKEILSDIVSFLSSPRGLLIFILDTFQSTFGHFLYFLPISAISGVFKDRMLEKA